jgi:hypothetical protein
VGVAAEQPDKREELRIDAQPGEVGVADIGEQPAAILLGNGLQGRP